MEDNEDINQRMQNMAIDEEENAGFVLEGDVEDNTNRYELCLVGRLLTEKSINTKMMKSRLADVWRPTMGINIKDLDKGMFLFQFFRKEDMQWVTNGGPWSFDNAMLALEKVETGENPANISPCFVSIWIQLFNLPMGYMKETVGKQLGNFFGEFLEYDAKNNASIWRECMRVRIKIDVRQPLKRKKKIIKKDGKEFIVECKYERLGEFCFVCGLVSHTDRFCRMNISGGDERVKEWGRWLRATPRRVAGQTQSKWLRDEGDDTWEERIGGEYNKQRESRGGNSNQTQNIRVASDYRKETGIAYMDGKDKYLALKEANLEGFTSMTNQVYEQNEEASEFIQLEDRKRRRGTSNQVGLMDIDTSEKEKIEEVQAKYLQQGIVISNEDLSVTSYPSPAELAMQASHSK